MPISNSSIGSTDGDEEKLSGPGHRTGEGAESVLPYLHDSLATRPGELFAGGEPAQRKPRRSLASRLRRALFGPGQSTRSGGSNSGEPR